MMHKFFRTLFKRATGFQAWVALKCAKQVCAPNLEQSLVLTIKCSYQIMEAVTQES